MRLAEALVNNQNYYIAVHIEWLKIFDKSYEQACWYHTISARLLDIVRLFGCLRMLPLYDIWYRTSAQMISLL